VPGFKCPADMVPGLAVKLTVFAVVNCHDDHATRQAMSTAQCAYAMIGRDLLAEVNAVLEQAGATSH